jgi:tRNA 2-thiocytidine biosynthesis protein TtcA
VDVEKTILRKVGEAVGRFRMIRAGDRVAVGVSGGKDSLTLL